MKNIDERVEEMTKMRVPQFDRHRMIGLDKEPFEELVIRFQDEYLDLTFENDERKRNRDLHSHHARLSLRLFSSLDNTWWVLLLNTSSIVTRETS